MFWNVFIYSNKKLLSHKSRDSMIIQRKKLFSFVSSIFGTAKHAPLIAFILTDGKYGWLFLVIHKQPL